METRTPRRSNQDPSSLNARSTSTTAPAASGENYEHTNESTNPRGQQNHPDVRPVQRRDDAASRPATNPQNTRQRRTSEPESVDIRSKAPVSQKRKDFVTPPVGNQPVQNMSSPTEKSRHAPNRPGDSKDIEPPVPSMQNLRVSSGTTRLAQATHPSVGQDPLGLGRPMHYSPMYSGDFQTYPTGNASMQSETDANPRLLPRMVIGTTEDSTTPPNQYESSEYGVSDIDNKTKGSGVPGEIRAGPNIGPKVKLLEGLPQEELDRLHKSYYERYGQEGKKFFIIGRVFSIFWHTNAGHNKDKINLDADKPFHYHTITRDGEYIFSSIRRYVIVKARPHNYYCWAVPINSYGKRGLSKKKFHENERRAHAIIHTKGIQPKRIQGEKAFTKKVIQVDPENSGDILETASRIHFGKVQSIEWNVKVKDCGRVTGNSLRNLKLYFEQECSGTSTDAIEEVHQAEYDIAPEDEDEADE